MRRGWTTGACATAATKAAYAALLTGRFSGSRRRSRLPKGETAELSLWHLKVTGEGWAQAGIVKDAGDDPDVTHGCLVIATVRPGGAGRDVQGGRGGRAR